MIGAVAGSLNNSSSDKTSSVGSSTATATTVVKRLKYEMCKNWREKGNCKYGDKCLFAHGADELTKRSSANGPEPVKPLVSATPAEVKKEVVVEATAVVEERKPVAATTSSPTPTKISLPVVAKDSGVSVK